jgi:hypothetical protein
VVAAYGFALSVREQPNAAFREGFRMTAHRDDAACTGAGVRKPSREGNRGKGCGGLEARYGDLSARACGIYGA